MPVDFFGIGIFGRGDLHVCGCGGWFAFVVYVGLDKGGGIKGLKFCKMLVKKVCVLCVVFNNDVTCTTNKNNR